MTKDYIISISSGHRYAAVDLGISILLLPPAVLHNQADKFTTAKEGVKLAKRRVLRPHKGLGKHNTISVARSILTCNGLATLKSSPAVGGRCRFWRLEWSISLPFQWPHSRNNPIWQWGEHLQWTSRCFLHHKHL